MKIKSKKIETEKYRFQTGSLYKYNKEANAYIHVFKQPDCDTKTKAIRRYEAYLEDLEDLHSDYYLHSEY